jgi:hypothetical protein
LNADDISFGGIKSLHSITEFIAKEFNSLKSHAATDEYENPSAKKDISDELAYQYKIAKTSNISISSILPAKELVKTIRVAVGVNDEDLVKNKNYRELKDEIEKLCSSKCSSFKDFLHGLDKELSAFFTGKDPHRRTFKPNSRS